MESELIAGFFASAEGIRLNKLGDGFHINFIPIPIFTDNQSMIAYSKYKINNNHMKHSDIHYHYMRDQIIARKINLICYYIISIIPKIH